MNMLQGNSGGDVSLEGIAVMAQTQDGESNMLPEVTVYGCKFYVSGYYDSDGQWVEGFWIYYTSSYPC